VKIRINDLKQEVLEDILKVSRKLDTETSFCPFTEIEKKKLSILWLLEVKLYFLIMILLKQKSRSSPSLEQRNAKKDY
jgi:hypothetical protein